MNRRRIVGISIMSGLFALNFAACGSNNTCGDSLGGGGLFGDFASGPCDDADGAINQDGTVNGDGTVSGDGTTGDGSTFVPPDGSVTLPDGAILLPDGAVVQPDGAVIGGNDAGPFVAPDGSVILPDGGLLLPDGAVIRPDGGPIVCVPVTCEGKTYACGDCIDNDGDGKTDSFDPECLGPCDRSESIVDLEIPSGGVPVCKVDCYYDGDNGSGNDTCEWDHACDPHEVAASFYPREELGNKCAYDEQTKFPGNRNCADVRQALPDGGLGGGQPASCINYCGPLTPNGCDCFGCCTFPALENVTDPVTGAKPAAVYLGSRDAQGNLSCTIAGVTDPTKCHPCQQVPSCNKPCGRCQLCIGKTSIPDDCFPTVVNDAGPFVAPDGSVNLQDGAVQLPDGAVVQPDGAVVGADAATSTPDSGGGSTISCPQFLCLTGGQPCGLSTCAACPSGNFCNTGCCVPNPN